ncbi:hypothetical protein LPJ77_002922 [Coemansia sp. RSA 2523]|nr:hypothetical protein LPJ58_005689 [Coemansia sp. RSA 1591]KAJ1753207.1 hypothetical protein LPJ69_005688 [Coemansia sp. RSA 1752]KAJ1787095.1 hypothetical protein LPJ62_003519 [Coemansia sp. RSA 2167]KAJ1807588.1 hypothetical protein LPJ77_002922 [Coemansia sp. RSA 2523]KAJ2148108.1 hypothetical protein J3F82_004754 [Coemansia sp. RSA 637]KAJ2168014.1 hypothetical protein GGH15_001708 [Coemansia sp. RSA 562]KAJ2293308.1 hypothetical protein IW141_001209 [Coemansia sp. RSA 355]KAJ2533948.1
MFAPAFSAVDVAATCPIDSSFNTSATTLASFSSLDASIATPGLFSFDASIATPGLFSLFNGSIATPELFSPFNASADIPELLSSFNAFVDIPESLSSFNTSAATLNPFSLFNTSADTLKPFSLFNTSAAASAPIVLFYIIRPTPTCLVVDTDFDPASAADSCEAMTNPPLMIKRSSSAQIGQTNTVQLCLALICAAFCTAYIRGFKHTWMMHKQIQGFFTLPHATWATEPAVEATDNVNQAEYAPVTTYIATASQHTEPAVTNQEELLDSDMVQVA